MSIIFLEATTRFELVMEILQTSALPLGDVAIYYNKWCPEAESNHRHGDFQSPALPTELSGHFLYRGVAGVTRLELATSCVTGRRSNQLSYTPTIMVVTIGLEPMTPCL